MHTKDLNPVHRKKNVLNVNKIVDRNPTSVSPVFIVIFIMCSVAVFMWFNDKSISGRDSVSISSGEIAQDSMSDLHVAIKKGYFEEIRNIIEDIDEIELNAVINGMTPVMTASSIGDAKVVELLLKRGANPNKRGSAKRTALQYAAEKNRIIVARKLLEYGADIDAYDNTQLTPLIMAADRGYTDLGILLIESGADVNIQHVQGWTALIDAAGNGNMKLVSRLLEAGANREISTGKGKRAIDFARQNKHQDIVVLLAE